MQGSVHAGRPGWRPGLLSWVPMSQALIKGAEPASWEGGPGGALVLHGFTGSPNTMRAVASALAGAGLAVELPLLPGHGTQLDDLVPMRWAHWAEAAEDALERLEPRCERVVVVGLSMGGTLACWLAARRAEIAGIVVVNPLVDPPAASFREVLEGLLDSGVEVGPHIGSDIKAAGVGDLAYGGSPLRALLSLFEATDALLGELALVRCPVLLFSSREDHVVPTSSGDVLAAAVGGPVERVWLEDSYHVAPLDNDAAELRRRTVDFAREVTGMAGAPIQPGM